MKINDNLIKFEYSTEERVVGTYFDKTLYRKSIFMDSLTFNAINTNIKHGIENIGKVKSIDYSMFYSPESSWYTNWDNIINQKTNSSNIVFTLKYLTGSVTFTDVSIDIEYTKTQ